MIRSCPLMKPWSQSNSRRSRLQRSRPCCGSCANLIRRFVKFFYHESSGLNSDTMSTECSQKGRLMMQLGGIHHISAITGNVSQNVAFYTQVLGLHLVKKTVNQDDV